MNMEPRLYFPKEFFRAETREDFLIDTTMKTVWAAEMELLSDIDAVCTKYGLQYFAYWGTLLGAVRHHGFVPWDDDMDLAMRREDYNRLMKILPSELPETYGVQWALSEKGRDNFWGCVTNADTISVEPQRLRKFHGCPFQIGIDIVPLDYIPRDKDEAKRLYSYLALIRRAAILVKQKKGNDEEKRELEEIISFLEKNMEITFTTDQELPNQLWKFGTELASSYGDQDGDLLTVHTTNVESQNIFFYPKDWWMEADAMPFENLYLPIPMEYDKVLRKLYGDYNVRVRGHLEHEYPFYNKQLRLLREMVKNMEKKSPN